MFLKIYKFWHFLDLFYIEGNILNLYFFNSDHNGLKIVENYKFIILENYSIIQNK